MEIIKSIIIAIVQGIAEFVPISSSGHIILLKTLLGFDVDQGYDILLHMGTLVAVFIVFRREILELITGLFKHKIHSSLYNREISRLETMKIWGLYIVATIPGGLAGLFIKGYFDKTPSEMGWIYFVIIGAGFLITGLMLVFSGLFSKTGTRNILNLGVLRAIIIGCFQGFGVLPGVSRSGSTISGALFTGMDREEAGRFSFVLSIPIILASFLLDLYDSIKIGAFRFDFKTFTIYGVGFVTAFLVGYFSLKILLKFIKKGKLWVFSLYLLIPAITSFVIAILKSGR